MALEATVCQETCRGRWRGTMSGRCLLVSPDNRGASQRVARLLKARLLKDGVRARTFRSLTALSQTGFMDSNGNNLTNSTNIT
jgi:hypothetical protein